MSRKIITASACFAALLFCTTAAHTVAQQYHPAPLGVHAHTNIDVAIKEYKEYRKSTENPEDEHTWLRGLYQGMFENNPGLSGITFGIYWDRIQKNDPDCALSHDCLPGTDANGNDWSYLDDVFTEAKAQNKTVILLITPGFNSPQWLFDRLSPSCDPLFGPVLIRRVPNCGKVTFSKFPEKSHADGDVLPLPWNATYQYWWQQFLSELNDRYSNHKEFAAIAIAGPNGASSEMILPTTADGSTQSPGEPADEAWSRLIGNSFPLAPDGYETSDQVFVEAWESAIMAYEGIFTNVTLFLTPDNGDAMPEFGDTMVEGDPGPLFLEDCSTATQYPLSCQAKTDILTYFLATQDGLQLGTTVGGMTAVSPVTPQAGDRGIGLGGVKILTSLPWPSPPILGGSEFDWSVTEDAEIRRHEGCTKSEKGTPQCKNISVEEAAYNVLGVYFYGTEFATEYGATADGSAPIQWLDIDYRDIVWAQTNGATPNNGTPCNQSLQDLINGASWYLFTIDGKTPPVAPPSCM